MTKSDTPLEARKAFLSAVEVPVIEASARNTHACDTLSVDASCGWPCTLFSGATHSAWAMTKSDTPLDERKAFLSAVEVPAIDASARNTHACATVIVPEGV